MSLFFIENIANNDIISFQKIGPEVDLIKMEIKINDLIEYRNKLLAKRDRNTPKHVKQFENQSICFLQKQNEQFVKNQNFNQSSILQAASPQNQELDISNKIFPLKSKKKEQPQKNGLKEKKLKACLQQSQEGQLQQNGQKILSSRIFFFLMIFNISLGGFTYLSIQCIYNTLWNHIPEIYQWDKKDKNSLIGLTNSILSFGQIIACLLNGFVMQVYGRRISLIIGHSLCMIGSLCTFTIINTPLMMFGRFVQGIAQGIIITSMPLYNIQISPTEYRGIVRSIQSIFFGLGLIISFVVGLGLNEYDHYEENNYWRMMLSVPFIASTSALLGFLLMVRFDSITFLYQKQKDNCEYLIEIFKAYLTKEEIQIQIENLRKQELNSQSMQILTLKQLFSREYLKPFLISLMLCLTPHLNGVDILNIYSNQIIEKYDSIFVATIFTTLIAIADLISCCLSILVINRFGRKQLYIFGQIFLSCSIILYEILSYSDNKRYLKFILIAYKFVFGLCLANILTSYSSEILPAVGIQLVNMIVLFIQLGLSQSFPSIIESQIQDEGIYLVFCLISIVFVILAKIYMKETKNVAVCDLNKLYN